MRKTSFPALQPRLSLSSRYHILCVRVCLSACESLNYSFFFNFVIGGKLLYSVVLVSAIQQLESAIIKHISCLPSLLNSLTPPF